MKKIGMLFAVSTFFFCFSSQAAEISVSSGAAFQAALTAASSNGESDTILLASGSYDAGTNGGPFTYVASVSEAFSLTIQGAGSETIVTGAETYAALVIDTSTTLTSDTGITLTLQNLTIEDGLATADPGPGCVFSTNEASVTVENVLFQNNLYTGSGDPSGALTIYTKNPSAPLSRVITVQNNIFQNNESSAESGGGLRVSFGGGSTATIDISDNTFIQNTAPEASGAIVEIGGGTLTMENNTFEGNEATGDGPGALAIQSEDTNVTLGGNIFQANTSADSAGGPSINVTGGELTLSANLFTENTSDAGAAGGLILLEDANAQIVNNIVSNNVSAGSLMGTGINGAGLLVAVGGDGTVDIVNNTITGNSAPDGSGGGLAVVPLNAVTCTANIANNIIYGNTALDGADIYLGADFMGGSAAGVSFNVSSNDYAVLLNDCSDCTFTETANINEDPDFVDSSAGDYHLLSTSACIGTADSSVDGYPALDFDGVSRASSADMGALEFVASGILSVNPVALVFDPSLGLTTQTVTLTNSGSGSLSVTNIVLSATSVFTLDLSSCAATAFDLVADESCDLMIGFDPSSGVASSANLVISAGDSDTTVPISSLAGNLGGGSCSLNHVAGNNFSFMALYGFLLLLWGFKKVKHKADKESR